MKDFGSYRDKLIVPKERPNSWRQGEIELCDNRKRLCSEQRYHVHVLEDEERKREFDGIREKGVSAARFQSRENAMPPNDLDLPWNKFMDLLEILHNLLQRSPLDNVLLKTYFTLVTRPVVHHLGSSI